MRATGNLTRQLVQAMREHVSSGNPPRIPEAGRPLWQAFAALSGSRAYGAAGPNPISYREILAWCQLMRMPLKPHHIEIIRAMDRAWLNTEPCSKPVSRSGLTPALFDVLAG